MRARLALLLVAGVAVSGGVPPGVAAQTLTLDEALELAFPDAEIERRTAYLEPAELERARSIAGRDVEIQSEIVTHYVALRGTTPVGVAYFDAHVVRTLREVLMIVVDPGGRIRRVETVAFREPPEYAAPDGWLELFQDRRLDDALSLKGEIPAMTGATLTARAVTRAARRVLALHEVIDPLSGVRR